MHATKTLSKLDLKTLEAREVPAVFFSLSAAGTLTLTSDAASDIMQVSTVGNNIQAQFSNGATNGLTTIQINSAAVKSVVMNGGDGNDYLANTTSLPATINGGNGDDYLQGGFVNDTLNGNAGSDVLIDNSGGINTFNGGDGDDQLSSTIAGATMNGGNGNDLLYDIIGGSTHNGGAGTDTIINNAGDVLIGNDRLNNTADITVSFGATTAPAAIVNKILYVNGGAGNDTITIDDIGNGNVRVNINGQSAGTFNRSAFRYIGVLGGNGNDMIDNNTGDGSAANPGGAAVSMVAYGGAGNDDLRGSGAFDFLKGGGDNDTISARSGGGDFIGGDAGADTLLGDNGAGVNSGRDVLYADPADTVLTDGNDKVVGTFLFQWFNA